MGGELQDLQIHFVGNVVTVSRPKHLLPTDIGSRFKALLIQDLKANGIPHLPADGTALADTIETDVMQEAGQLDDAMHELAQQMYLLPRGQHGTGHRTLMLAKSMVTNHHKTV